MKNFVIDERIEIAVQNFESGYNCAQSVFLAYADVFDVNLEMAKMMSVSFGGGLGRMREVCGTVSAMAMLAGFRYPVPDKEDRIARTKNYEIVQKMATLFKKEHETIICRSLISSMGDVKTTPEPSERTAEFYAKRPCSKYVATAARIAGEMLQGKLDDLEV